jgi:uncharacterized protein (DUF58 family)
MALTGRAALLAVAGVGVVVLLGGIGFAVTYGALAVAVAVDLARAGSIRDLTFSRSGATRVRESDSTVVRLLVTNTGSRPVRGRIRDAWPPSARAAHEGRLDIAPGERRWVETTLRPVRRGPRSADRVTVRSTGPLGIAARQAGRVVPWTVRVLPAFASRRYLPEKFARLRQLDGMVAARIRGQGTEFDSLRDYVEGDDVRSIDWRATARRDGIVVRTWRPERDRRIIIVLDTGRTSAGRVGDSTRLDWALDAALLLAALASRAGDRVDVIAYDIEVRAAVSTRHGDPLETVVESVADVEPRLVETDMRGAVSELLRRARQRCLVVLFTALDPGAPDEGLLPSLGSITRRHELLVASVADPRVSELAGARGTVESVYGAAAAEQSNADRNRIAAMLRRRGVEVVDAPPDHFASAVADAYLALKAAGRL